MNRDLRKKLLRHGVDSFGNDMSLCGLGFQGDFGKGIPTGSGVYSDPGVNPWTLYGPLLAGATSVDAFATGFGSNAIPQLGFRRGQVAQGDYETEWVFCRLQITALTDLVPGQMWQIDENYNATLATTAGRVLGAQLGFSMMYVPATAIGYYYGWLARAGRMIVQAAAASIATGNAETTATAGIAKFVNSHTAGSGSTSPGTCNAWGASSNITFKADTVNGSPILNNLLSLIADQGLTPAGSIIDLLPGAVITGAGMPANAILSAIDKQGPGGSYRGFIGTNTAGNEFVAQNATATALQVTLTVTNMVQALVYWPSIAVLN